MVVGLVDVDVTAAVCSTEVVFATTVVMLGPDFVEVNCSDAVVVFSAMRMVISVMGLLVVDATVATCSTEVVITVLFELLMLGLSVTTVVILDPDSVKMNCSDAVVVFCGV